jgi:hypothetical protein
MKRLTALHTSIRPALLAGAACMAFSAGALAQDAPVDPAAAEADDAHADAAASFPRFEEAEAQFQFLDETCVECHNFEEWAGGVAFDTMDPATVAEETEVWEEAVRKLRGGLMPPAGETRPDAQKINAFIGWMENYLDHAAMDRQHAGHVALHRLNRTEYANAIRDLLALDIDPAALLPKDDVSDGFDNIAEVLQVSPTFVDQYISAARNLSVRAVGDPEARPAATTLVADRSVNQNFHVEGLPPGTRGGNIFTYEAPAAGEYTLSINDMATGGYVIGMEFEHTLVVTIDGERVYQTQIGGAEDLRAIDQEQAPAVEAINARLKNVPLSLSAGPHEIGVTFVAKTFAESDNWLRGFADGGGHDRQPRISSVEVRGPFEARGLNETPSRDKIFVCYPESADQESECAREIIANLARRAFRKAPTEADLTGAFEFYSQGHARGGFETGVQNALFSILASPNFLYRMAPPPEDAQPGDIYALDDVELASRLSFFLWSSIPDDELLEVAEAGRLSDTRVLNEQVERMLADPKAEALTTSFAFQWLNVNGIDQIDPDGPMFPNFSGALKSAFREEMRLFVNEMVREDRPVTEFLNADWTYVNQDLGLHYGINGVRGDQFRRVTLTDPTRFGLLGKGSILMVTSYPNRTAPVLRGAFILENIVGAPPAAPPPNVEALVETQEGEKPMTVRERMVAHRADPSCNSCHAVMDPLGLALENFDAIGEWRDLDRFAGQTIDASGELPDGTALNGPVDLRNALLAKPDQFVQTFTQKLMTFALGRTVEHLDMPRVRAIVREAEAEDYRFSAIVKGIVNSDQFRMQEVGEPNAEAEAEPVEEASLQQDVALQ